MNPNEQQEIISAHNALPDGCKFDRATDKQLADFEAEFGTIPSDYRWYLLSCGGGVIGSEWVDGINELRETHNKFRQERDAGNWTLQNFFPIGWDGAGNPFGFDLDSGAIVSEDHNFGGTHREADGFYGLLKLKGLIESVEQGGDGKPDPAPSRLTLMDRIRKLFS